MSTISVDIYSATKENIPQPVAKPSPVLNYTISLDNILQLFNFPELYIYDSSAKTIINLKNLVDYFPEYDPGTSGGGGGGNNVVTLTEEEYANLPSHDPETLYAIYGDDGFRLMLGDLPMTGGGSTSTSFATKFVTGGALGNASTFTIPE